MASRTGATAGWSGRWHKLLVRQRHGADDTCAAGKFRTGQLDENAEGKAAGH